MGTKKVDLDSEFDIEVNSPNSKIVDLDIALFKDKRPYQQVGAMYNGYGRLSGSVMSNKNVGQWVNESLVKALSENGYRLSSKQTSAPDLVGSISSVFCSGATMYDAEVILEAKLNSGAGINTMTVKGDYMTLNVMNSSSGYKKALEKALKEALESLIAKLDEKLK